MSMYLHKSAYECLYSDKNTENNITKLRTEDNRETTALKDIFPLRLVSETERRENGNEQLGENRLKMDELKIFILICFEGTAPLLCNVVLAIACV